MASGALPPWESNEAGAALVEAAGLQGLAGLLHGAVAADGRGWPDEAHDRLRDLHRALLARGVVQLELARRAQEILARAGVRSIPLKGAALAETYYPSVADRPMADVDLLALEGWPAAMGALHREGFRDVEAADHASALRDPVSGGILELHHSVCSSPGFYPLDAEGLWARSRPVGGQVGRVPSEEDLLIHLSLHAVFQHGLVLSLVQHLDFRRLLEQTPPDPDRVMALAIAARAEAPLAVALAAAAAVVAAPVRRDLRGPPAAPRAVGARPVAGADRGIAAGRRQSRSFRPVPRALGDRRRPPPRMAVAHARAASDTECGALRFALVIIQRLASE